MAINYKKYGNTIRQLRKSMKLNQQDVYKLTGISVDTLRIIEGGSREPKVATLERLSEVYKTDLIFLLSTYRTEDDFFSDELLSDTNKLLNNLDLKGFIKRIDEMIVQTLAAYEKDSYRRNNLEYIEYLKSFKNMGITEAHYKEQDTLILEKLLFFFNKTTSHFLDDPAMINLEVQTGITLAILYRFQNKFNPSVEVLNKIIKTLTAIEKPTLRQIDYLVNATLHLCFCYHRLDNHTKVIDLVDKTLQQGHLYFCRETLTAFFLRKAVACYNLKSDDYKSLYATVLLMETPKRILDIRMRTKSNYGFDPIEFLHSPNAQTLDELRIDEI